MSQRFLGFAYVAAAAMMLAAARVSGQTTLPTPQAAAARASALLQTNQADSAIAILEALYQRAPQAAAGRVILANAYRQKGELEKALRAYRDAVTPPISTTVPPVQRSQAHFNLAGLYALQGNRSEALTHLEALKASGAFDMDLVRPSADFKTLIGDPRFEATMFKPADFVNPFVEQVKIIHEWVGETRGDQFGWIARGIGDVDGDGVPDVVSSSPTYGANRSGVGRVYVYSGKSGRLVWMQTGRVVSVPAGQPAAGGAPAQPTQRGEALGVGLEGAGDVNADGVPDVIAGAPGGNRAYVYSGRDGTTLLTLDGPNGLERFGATASGIGDQNGDGFADVAVGAPNSNAVAVGAGRAYFFSGKDGALLLTLNGEEAGDAFGSIVDGHKDRTHALISIGAPGAGPRNTGRVYIYPGLSPTPKFTIEADSTGAALGAMFTSIVGDLNGDKVPDIYATDFTNTANGASTGRAYVHSGADGRRLHTLTGEHPGNMFGDGSADVGDVNKDGYVDLLIGAWQYSGAAGLGGRIYLHSGKDGALLRTITGRVPGETLGFDATGVGDVDGDAVADFLVTSAWSNIRGFQSGRMFLISGK